MKNGSAGGSAPHNEPAEAALMQEFASYLAQLSTSFSAPLAERMAAHESDIVGRVRKLADEIDRQRQSASDRLAADEKALVAKVKALCDEVDRHSARVADSQAALAQGLATAVDPLKEAVRDSTDGTGRVVREFAAAKQAIESMTVAVSSTRSAIWACIVLSLVSFATTLWLALR